MRSKLSLTLVPLLLLGFFLVVLSPPQEAGVRTLPSTTVVWSGSSASLNGSAAVLSALLPARAPEQGLFTTGGSGSNNYWVGAESASAADLSNSGIQATIDVVSTQVAGCLSFWVADEMGSNTVWGQVGYYICNGATPVAFYQVWSNGVAAVTGTTTVAVGNHRFSMYDQSGTVWAYALDGGVFGTYDMGSSTSSSTYPVEVLSEEGYVSGPWNPPAVEFALIQVMHSGVWAYLQFGYAPYGCGQTNLNSCWGVAGNLQNSSIPADAQVVGGSAAAIASGTILWNGPLAAAGTSTTSSSVTSSASSTPSSSTFSASTFATSMTSSAGSPSASTTTVQAAGAPQMSLTVSPTSTKVKSTEYFTVKLTDAKGNPLGGVGVTLTTTGPSGKAMTAKGTTDANGFAYFQYRVSAAAPKGTYTVSATALISGFGSVAAKGAFTVS